MKLLEIKDLKFGYEAKAILKSISLAADPGEFMAVVGANGAGKSTLLDLMSGFKPIGEGSVKIAGKPLSDWSARELAHRVSHLPQAVHADLPFTAGQLVGMGRYPHTDQWFESEEDHRLMRAAMERTNCWEWRARKFASLSGGERQRVLLAACLAQEAEILLLDEPSTFLDVDQQLQCFSLLREEAAAGKLCIAVTHDLNLALTFCTRIIVIADGVVARDMLDVEAAVGDWLPLFSSRLAMGRTDNGAPWVWYR